MGLTRKDSQAQTRARLIEVGRTHFLRDGLGGAVAEKIASDAGFTRGAFYANFASKEELFLAVVEAGREARIVDFQAVLESDADAATRYAMMREAMGDMVTNPEWVLLRTEFLANALRKPAIRQAFVESEHRQRAEGARLIGQFAEQLGLELSGTPEEVAEVLGSLAEGLAIRQAVAEEGEGEGRERRKKVAMLCFDRLVSAAETQAP